MEFPPPPFSSPPWHIKPPPLTLCPPPSTSKVLYPFLYHSNAMHSHCSLPHPHNSIHYLPTQMYIPSHCTSSALLPVQPCSFSHPPPSPAHLRASPEGFTLVVHAGGMAAGCSAVVIIPKCGYMQSSSAHSNTLLLSFPPMTKAC